MAVLQITLSPGVPRSRQRVQLDGREYVIVLRWSQREACWYMDLRDADDVLLAGSVKLVVGFPLLYRFVRVPGVPPGELIVVDGRANPADPTLAELGDVAQIVYLDAAEMAAMSATTAASGVSGGGAPGIPGDG